MSTKKSVISLKNIYKEFVNDNVVTKVLFDVAFDIKHGDFVAIMGPSGSGKSTLMHIMSFLDRLTKGDYFFDGQKVSDLSDDELALKRRDEVGFVFQFFYLLSNSKVIDNILLPMVYQEVPYEKRIREATAVLKQVGLEHRMEHLSNQLSGGERQRVAIARALVGNPSVIFADEPTGNLDSKTGESILRLLQDLNDQGKTVIMVTHELEAAQFAKRIIRVRDGRIFSDIRNSKQRRKEFVK